MSRFDLQDPLDFARLTNGTLGNLISQFAGRDPSQWDILEGRYNNVLFHVFESKTTYQAAVPNITDSGGRRKVKYRFPYRDGQTTDDLGRKPQSFDIEILLHGQRYLEGYRALMTELDKPTPGTLIHPVRGTLQVVPEDFQIVHSNEKRQAMILRVTFIEHNFDVGNFRQIKDPTPKGALTKALETFQRVENVIANVQGAINLVTSVKNSVAQALDEYNSQYGITLTKMNQAFNSGSNTDIPTLLPLNQGGTRNSDGSVVTEQFPVARSFNDPFQNVPVSTLQPAQSTAITVSDLFNDLVDRRTEVAAIIQEIVDGGGALELYEDILSLRQTAVDLQEVFEKGSASSQSKIVEYITPRLMSLREAAFENGIDVDRVQELDILNPELESLNYIPQGTTLKVPIS